MSSALKTVDAANRHAMTALNAMNAGGRDPNQIKPNPNQIKSNPNQVKSKSDQNPAKSRSKSNPNQNLIKTQEIPEKSYEEILGSPRTSVVPSPQASRDLPVLPGPPGLQASLSSSAEASLSFLGLQAPLEGRASGASEAGVLGTTKEVLGFIIEFLEFK